MLNNWKTYVVAALGVILNGLVATGHIDVSVIDTVNVVLGFLGLGTVRHAISKAQK